MRMPHYFTRVRDYVNDPFFPCRRWHPGDWVEALWACLWNRRFYEDPWL